MVSQYLMADVNQQLHVCRVSEWPPIFGWRGNFFVS